MNRPQTSARENELLAQAQRYLPGGVLGTQTVPDDLAFVVKRAQGSRVWDVSGREYLDHLLSSGRAIWVTHASSSKPSAVRSATGRATSG